MSNSSCSVAPASIPSDAGIAGIGVLISFIVTAVLALGLSTSLIIQEQFTKSRRTSIVRRKLLNAYSDQSIFTGIGIQSVGLVQIHTISIYHFFFIWMLSLLVSAVHNATLLALCNDFRRDWVLRWLRQFLMFVNLVLSCVYGIFILEAVGKKVTDTTLSISCVWDGDSDLPVGPGHDIAASFAGTIAVIAANVIIFGLATWYLHSRTQKFYRIIQIVGLVLMTASAIGTTARVIPCSQAFGSPSITLSDEGEKRWSFGALLQLLLLLLPVVSLIEILRGEIKVAPPVMDDDDKSRLLKVGSELHSFQPNPIFGSQSN